MVQGLQVCKGHKSFESITYDFLNPRTFFVYGKQKNVSQADLAPCLCRVSRGLSQRTSGGTSRKILQYFICKGLIVLRQATHCLQKHKPWQRMVVLKSHFLTFSIFGCLPLRGSRSGSPFSGSRSFSPSPSFSLPLPLPLPLPPSLLSLSLSLCGSLPRACPSLCGSFPRLAVPSWDLNFGLPRFGGSTVGGCAYLDPQCM